jgi:hypothetical protein
MDEPATSLSSKKRDFTKLVMPVSSMYEPTDSCPRVTAQPDANTRINEAAKVAQVVFRVMLKSYRAISQNSQANA